MSGKSGNEKKHEYHSKIENREHKISILNSKDFYYSRSRERLYRHLRGRLKYGRSMEERERDGSGTSKVFVGIFYFAINERKNNSRNTNDAFATARKIPTKVKNVSRELTHKALKKKACNGEKKVTLTLVKSRDESETKKR